MRRREISPFLGLASLELLRVWRRLRPAQVRSSEAREGTGVRVEEARSQAAGPRAGRRVGVDLPAPGSGPEIARARTRFLVDEPVRPGAVRAPILASWTRSRLAHVRPDRLDLPLEPGTDDDTILTRAAEPVLREIADLFATEPVSVILCDADGVVLSRLTGDSGARAAPQPRLAGPRLQLRRAVRRHERHRHRPGGARAGPGVRPRALRGAAGGTGLRGRADPPPGDGQGPRHRRPDVLATRRRAVAGGHRRHAHPPHRADAAGAGRAA